MIIFLLIYNISRLSVFTFSSINLFCGENLSYNLFEKMYLSSCSTYTGKNKAKGKDMMWLFYWNEKKKNLFKCNCFILFIYIFYVLFFFENFRCSLLHCRSYINLCMFWYFHRVICSNEFNFLCLQELNDLF